MIILKDGKEYDYKISSFTVGYFQGITININFQVYTNNEFAFNYAFNISGDQATNLISKWCAEKDIYSYLSEGVEDITLRNKIWKAHNNFILICDQLRTILGLEPTQTKLSTPDSQAMLGQLEAVNPMAAVKFGLMLLGSANEVSTIGSSWYHIVWHPEIVE